MNRATLLNLFKRGLSELLAAVDRELARPQRDPYTEVDPNRRPHEHDTRLLFVDELLGHLGWRLGAGGNVLEEARLQTNTTKFMDYVGVVDIAGAPLLLVEAKAWDKPAILARAAAQDTSEASLVAAAIKHIVDGKTEETSPIIAEWDGYLRQVRGYVHTLKQRYDHYLPRAVIISGEWMVVFTNPVATFLINALPHEVVIFKRSQFQEKAEDIFNLLHRSVLTEDAPIPLRPAQLRQFVELNSVAGAFRGVHVHYEKTGSTLFTRRPRILIYPALFVARDDDAVFTVIENDTSFELDYQADNNGVETLVPHLDAIRGYSAKLILACEEELGGALPVAELSDFPGFRSAGIKKAFVGGLQAADEWLVATGGATHFLLPEPRVQQCRFHSWAECGADAALPSAIMARSVDPPAFFVDAQCHHCAHQVVQDRRDKRCLIQAIDSRTCCQACIYLEHCWTAEERAALPCGN